MYLNPTGSNPTGAVLSAARRQEIYDICSMYDILILEDDPYYFMQFREASQQTSQVLKKLTEFILRQFLDLIKCFRAYKIALEK